MSELRIVLACQEAAGAHALRLAADSGHRVVAVLTDATREPDGASGVAAAAARLGVPVREAALVRDPSLAAWLRAESVDLLLNVHSLYRVAEPVLSAPAIGSFNLHPGPLPAYAGLNAPSWAILEGAPTYGCTLHWMSADVDAGPVAYTATFPVEERDTGLTLAARCAREGLALVARLLDDARGGGAAIPRLPQAGAPVDRGPGPPDGGRVTWTHPAEGIAALVRACDYGPYRSPWGRPRAVLAGEDVGLVRASVAVGRAPAGAVPGDVVELDGDAALVVAGEGSVLRLARVELRGGIAVAAASVRPGARFS